MLIAFLRQFRDVVILHKSEVPDHTIEPVVQRLNFQPLLFVKVSFVMGDDGQENNAFVEHFVVFQIVEQGQRHNSRSARQINCCAFHPVRRRGSYVIQKQRQWEGGALQPLAQESSPGFPGCEQCT